MPQIDVIRRSQGDEEAQRLEYEVFVDSGYIEPNAQGHVLEYDAYPEAEFLVLTVDKAPAGAVRLIYDHARPFPEMRIPTLTDFPLLPEVREQHSDLDCAESLEVGTMAIAKPYRGRQTLNTLLEAILHRSWEQGIWNIFASLDEKYFHFLVKHGYPFRAIGEKRHYMGSVTVPALLLSDDFEGRFQTMYLPYRKAHRS